MYLVTRQFVGGTLKGQVHTEVTSVRWTVGTVVSNPVGGSPYKIISVGVDDPAADGRLDGMCELVEKARDLIDEPLPDSAIVRECIDGVLNTRNGKLLRSAPNVDAKPLANVFWYLVDWHTSGGYLGTLLNCQFKCRSIAKARGLDITGAELYAMLETLAIVLRGGNSPAVDRWARALGHANIG